MVRSPFGLKSASWVSMTSMLVSVACSDGDIPDTNATGGISATVGGSHATGGKGSTGGSRTNTGGRTGTGTGGYYIGGQTTVGGTENGGSGATSGAANTSSASGGTGQSSGGAFTVGGSGITGGAANGGSAGAGGNTSCTSIGSNVLTNGSFESGTAHGATIPDWLEEGATQYDLDASYLEFQTAHTGTGRLGHWAANAFKVATYQQVNSIPNGTYTLRAWVMRDPRFSTEYLFARGYSATDTNAKMTADTATASSTSYTEIVLNGIQVTNGTCEVGIYSDAPNGGVWANIDDFSLVLVNSTGCVTNTGGASSTGGSNSLGTGGQPSTGG